MMGWMLVGVVTVSTMLAAPARAETVTCKATKGFWCANLINGCRQDRAYEVKFDIDYEKKTITDLKEKYVFTILPRESLALLAEHAIMGTRVAGTMAQETIVIGQKSYLSSHSSVVPIRAWVQIGTCEGLKGPGQ